MHVATLLITLASISSTRAHIALWDKGMFGYNYPYQASDTSNINWDSNEPVWPLRYDSQYTVDQWFGHGYKNYPPKDGDFMVLPAGGTYNAELQCNRAGTTMRNPDITDALPQYACDNTGPLHVMNQFNSTVDPKWFGGTALAIAYTSDVSSLQPNDMTVISVNTNSVWTRVTPYDIPAGLPPCPSGGCLCTWNWIHEANHGEGYGQEIYNTLYRCTVTGSTDATKTVYRGAIPVDCTSDSSKCVSGPKTPMYLYQGSGNNLPNLDVPPRYNTEWGFSDGAQNDVFKAAATPAPTTGGATPTATALPSGWTAKGCYVDAEPRVLQDYRSGSISNLTISGCVSLCAGKGYGWAGVENGNECYCGYTATNQTTAADSTCNVPCNGDIYANCGGPWRVNLFNNPALGPAASPTAIAASALPTGWSSIGCLAESATYRAFTSYQYQDDAMTVPMCINQCAGLGYPYAGTQYGKECWCGNSATNTTFNYAPDSDCNMACAGDAYTTCGAGYRMNAYRLGSALTTTSVNVTVTPTPTVNSTTVSATAAATVNSTLSQTVSPSNTTTLASTTTNGPSMSTTTVASSSTTTAASTTTSSTTTKASSSSSSSASSSSTTTTATTKAASSSSSSTTTTTTTAATTTAKASSSSSSSSSSSTTTAKASSTTSSTTTTAATTTTKPVSQTTTDFATRTSTTTATSTTSTAPASTNTASSAWKSLGCFVDTSIRVLDGVSTSWTNNSPAMCTTWCGNKGYKYAGMEYSGQCYCGNTFSSSTKSAPSDCTTPCNGDKSLTCGGTWRISVYQSTSMTKRDELYKHVLRSRDRKGRRAIPHY